MSTLLVIPEEVTNRGTAKHESWMREMPYGVFSHRPYWWRKRLRPNRDGHSTVIQLQVDNLTDWESKNRLPWSMRVEYFDGRQDWSFPLDYTFVVQSDAEDWEDHYAPKTIITRQKVWLDVLMPQPPGGFPAPGMAHWRMLPGQWDYGHCKDYYPHPDQEFYDKTTNRSKRFTRLP